MAGIEVAIGIEGTDKALLNKTTGCLVPPSRRITSEMIRIARVDDDWHFSANLNALMAYGYCKICGLTPDGCDREGCGVRR